MGEMKDRTPSSSLWRSDGEVAAKPTEGPRESAESAAATGDDDLAAAFNLIQQSGAAFLAQLPLWLSI